MGEEENNRKLKNFREGKKIDSTEIMYIDEGRIIIINLETLSKSKTPLHIVKEIDLFISMCRLPNNEVFCFGNGPELTFIFNSEGDFRQLPYDRPYDDSGCVYYNGNIYTFGGSLAYNSMKNAYKFDLSRNRWSRLANMPVKSLVCSCAVLQNKIIISCNDGSCVYDPDIDSYTNLSSNSEIDDSILYVFRDRGYIIDLWGNIHESYANNPYMWFYSGMVTSSLDSLSFGYFGDYNDAFYFLLRNFCLYKFDINSNQVSKVSLLEE